MELAFELSYSCGREGSSHQQSALAEVVPDAGPVLIDLELPGEQAWFIFDAQVGATYELVTRPRIADTSCICTIVTASASWLRTMTTTWDAIRFWKDLSRHWALLRHGHGV